MKLYETMHTDHDTDMKAEEAQKKRFTRAIEDLQVHDHLCLIYETHEEQMAAAVPFIKVGIEQGDQCIYIADDNDAESVKQAMQESGIDVKKAMASGALAVVTKHEAYLKQGYFDPDWMIGFLRQATSSALKNGYRALRATGEMTWIFGGEPGVDRLIEYEAKLNYFFPENEALAICQYNRNRFTPQIINNVIYTHPLVIYGTSVCENPYYIPPDEFLSVETDKEAVEADRLLQNIVARQNAEDARRSSQQSLQEAFNRLQQADEAIRVSEARYRMLFDNSPDALSVVDPETGLPVEFNNRMPELLGYTPQEFAKLSVSDYEAKEVFAETQAHMDGIVHEGGDNFETQLRCKDGSIRDVKVSIRVIEMDGRRLLHSIITDISDIKAREQRMKHLMGELERSNAELQQFADVASHDLQEPLRMVASYVELLRNRYSGRLDDDADDFIAYAVDGANRMQHIIADLLAYARVGSRGKPFTPVDMNEVLCKATDNLSRTIDETDTLISADRLPRVTADGSQLVQVLQNLIANAIKFRTAEPPRVYVGASRVDSEWQFSVSDNGIGIDPEYFERIFVIFQRLHGREEYPGTGVGLAICKRIIERHGGRIWVESEPERGATFYFSLPDNPEPEGYTS